jgi:hypothetical protein
MVAAVESPGREFAIFGAVAVDVAIEQIGLHAADVHALNLEVQKPLLSMLSVSGRPSLPTAAASASFHDLGIRILFDLVAVVVEALLEVALVVEQTDGDKRNAEIARGFHMVAREHAEAAG